MNTNGDYTICNLDNHTYTSNYPTENITTSGYTYNNVNNTLVDTGQLSYGGGLQHQHGQVEMPHGGVAHHPPHLYGGTHGGHHAHNNGILSAATPPPSHHYMHPAATCLPNSGHPYHDYYSSGMLNGGVDVPNPASPYPYPDPTAGHGHQPHGMPTAGGYPPHHMNMGNGGQEQAPVTTYKWMTVKRSTAQKGI